MIVKTVGFVALCTSILLSVSQRVFMINQNEQKNFMSKRTEVENCLMSCYRIDRETATSVSSWLNPLISNEKYHPIIDAFIEKAKNLPIQFENSSSPELLADDAVLKAAQWHTVLFEDAHIRILRGIVNSGECVSPHTHQWNRLMIVIQGTIFKTEYSEGTVEIDDIPIGVYEEHVEMTPSAPSTNIGNTAFEALLFEVKK